MEVKEEFWNAGFVVKIKHQYRIADGYRMLMGDQEKVRWYEQVWNRGNFPKHSFICWLSVLGKLLTKDRLAKFAHIEDKICVICGKEEETIKHLFFECERTKKWLEEMKHWLGWHTKKNRLIELLRVIQRLKESRIKKQAMTVAIISLVYVVFKYRNKKILKGEETNDTEILRKVRTDTQFRMLYCCHKKASVKELDWVRSL